MPPLQPGDQLDHYRILDLAATGGMASVFRARDLRDGRAVAIKVPHPQAEADPVFYDRFLREIEIGKKLHHPAIVKVLEFDGCAGAPRSRLYMAMEWVDGSLLREILAHQGQLSTERAIAIALQICDALDYMHSHGIAHRDLKPENIFVDNAGAIRIIDFGIASTAGARRLTFGKLAELMGSPDYISPEQVKGGRGDARSDIYALGVILYEMLLGKLPFSGANAFAIMHDRVVNHPAPPREIDPRLSPQLQEILYRALERDPRSRYPAARDFAQNLAHPEQVCVGERPELRERQRRQSPLKRRMLSYLVLALVPVVLFGMLLYAARH